MAYRVYLNETLLVNEPSGLKDLSIEIIREDGFANSDQILRDKTDTLLSFNGDGYLLLCAAKKENYCQNVDIRIEYLCGQNWDEIFTGIIPIAYVEYDLTRSIAKTQIRDSSFTGLIKDYLKTEIGLFNTNTKNCEPIATPDRQIFFGVTSHLSFDALDTMQYLIGWITDNQITVESNTLTNSKIGFTLGYNLHNTTGSLDNIYPKITFNTLFSEIRKKKRIYMGIEYNGSVPYLRVETELSYFFENTKVLEFTTLPYGSVEKFDRTRLFNSIQVGSDKTTLQNSATGFVDGYEPNLYVPSNSTLSWDKRVYNSCGECTVEADSEQNKLDLVSSWIIDSDLIVEALSALPTDNDNTYAHDEDIFMFEYTETAGISTATLTLDPDTSQNIYNAGFRNSEVVTNWLGYSPQCISDNRNSIYGFKGFDPTAGATFQIGSSCYFRRAQFLADEVIYDTAGQFTDESYTLSSPCFGQSAGPYNTTVWHCTANGSYSFRGIIGNVVQSNGSFGYHIDYLLAVVIYSDDTFTTEVGRTETLVQVTDSQTQPQTLTVETLPIAVATGQVVALEYSIQITSGEEGSFIEEIDFDITNITFELTTDEFSCNNIEDTVQDSKPIILEFESAYCYEDLKRYRNNKKAYTEVNGARYWIKNIKAIPHTNKTVFILIGNDSQCPC